jgi:hypothetical protein
MFPINSYVAQSGQLQSWRVCELSPLSGIQAYELRSGQTIRLVYQKECEREYHQVNLWDRAGMFFRGLL